METNASEGPQHDLVGREVSSPWSSSLSSVKADQWRDPLWGDRLWHRRIPAPGTCLTKTTDGFSNISGCRGQCISANGCLSPASFLKEETISYPAVCQMPGAGIWRLPIKGTSAPVGSMSTTKCQYSRSALCHLYPVLTPEAVHRALHYLSVSFDRVW